MLMQNASSGDQFGVNFNFDSILLQIRETKEDYDEARIRLSPKDVDDLIEWLQHYKERVVKWNAAVGAKKDEETDACYATRIIETLRENNYFSSPQEA